MKIAHLIMLSLVSVSLGAAEVVGYWQSLANVSTNLITQATRLMSYGIQSKPESALQTPPATTLQAMLTELESALISNIQFRDQLLITISKANEIIKRPTASTETINATLKTLQNASEYLVKSESQIKQLQQTIDAIKSTLAQSKS